MQRPRTILTRIHRPGPIAVLYLVLLALLLASILTWLFDRHTAWANNWAPNFIAEWSGILIAVVVVERLVQAAQRREQAATYMALRHTAGVALGRALRPMVDFLLAVAEVTKIETKPGEELVVFFERVFEELPRSGIPDPKKCLAQWVEILDDAENRIRSVHDRYFMTLDPDEITQIDRLADSLSPRDWVLGSAGREPESEAATTVMKPFIYQATRPLRYLSVYFEEMVGAPLTTGPWHVAPEQHVWWRTMTEDWQRVREDERRRIEWTWPPHPAT
jgi:hypothetical protein